MRYITRLLALCRLGRTRSTLVAIGLLAVVSASDTSLASGTAPAPVAVETCPACASLEDLEAFALNGLRAVPGNGQYMDNSVVFTSGGTSYNVTPSSYNGGAVSSTGTILLVVSQANPIAAEFRYNKAINYGSRTVTYTLILVTTDESGTGVLDNLLHARAAKVAPINVPAEYGGAANNYESDEILEGFVNSVLVFKGQPGDSGVNFWHGLTHYPQFEFMTFTNMQTGEKVTLFNGDEITLKFPDGSTLKLKLVGIGAPSGLWFQVVPGSARDPNGNPYGTAQIPTPGGGGTTYPCNGSAWTCTDVPNFPGTPYCFIQAGGCIEALGSSSETCSFGWEEC